MPLHVDHGTVATLTLQNEGRMNSFDPAFLTEVAAALDGLLEDPAVRSVVLTGQGRAFSTGADVAAMAAAAQDGSAAQWVLDATAVLHPLMQRMHATPKPVIAAVNGVAAGGGLGLALACDVRIGAPEARFAAGYFGLGLSPDGGATWFLPRLLGVQRTRRFFFENEVMDADTALATGLLDEVVPAARLMERAREVATRWGAWSRHSTEATKRLLGASLHSDLAAQLDAERGLIAAAAAREDFKEGTVAFVEKRRPRFA